jgi:hypothetical protein
MRKLYSVLAWIVVGGVVVQAAAIGFGYGGMQGYVEGGGVVDETLVESGTGSFTGDVAFPVHEVVGGMLIPLVVVALAVASFWVRVPRARRWAWGLFLLVAVQAEMGYAIPELPYVGLVHGATALAVLLVAVHVARLPRRASAAEAVDDGRDEPVTRVPA